MNKADILKRIKFLDFQLKEKKTLVDRELAVIESICKELLSLKNKLEALENPTTTT
jgi:hypothetical protein